MRIEGFAPEVSPRLRTCQRLQFGKPAESVDPVLSSPGNPSPSAVFIWTAGIAHVAPPRAGELPTPWAQLHRGIAVRIPRSFSLLLSFGLFSSPALNDAVLAEEAAPVKVKLQAAIVNGAEALKDDIKWSIAPLSKDGTAAQDVTKPSPDIQLVPGTYRVTATLGFATATRDITIAEAGSEELVFDAGWAH